jgi:pyridoxamine 5'-phosphate oxidase
VTARLDRLEQIETRIWAELELATHDRQHAWRTPVLATVAGHGPDALADARTVVVREVEKAHRQLIFFSDGRSAKVAQLLAQPLGTMVMWSATLAWQLRCRVSLQLERSGLAASSRWARIKLTPAAQDYLSPLPPGSVLEPGASPVHEAVTRDHFAVIQAQVLGLDWLELDPQGHRRALFDAQGARWVQP